MENLEHLAKVVAGLAYKNNPTFFLGNSVWVNEYIRKLIPIDFSNNVYATIGVQPRSMSHGYWMWLNISKLPDNDDIKIKEHLTSEH